MAKKEKTPKVKKEPTPKVEPEKGPTIEAYVSFGLLHIELSVNGEIVSRTTVNVEDLK